MWIVENDEEVLIGEIYEDDARDIRTRNCDQKYISKVDTANGTALKFIVDFDYSCKMYNSFKAHPEINVIEIDINHNVFGQKKIVFSKD